MKPKVPHLEEILSSEDKSPVVSGNPFKVEEKVQSPFFEEKSEEDMGPEGEELHGDMDNLSHIGDSDDYVEIDEDDDGGAEDLFDDPFDDLDEDYDDDDEGNYF